MTFATITKVISLISSKKFRKLLPVLISFLVFIVGLIILIPFFIITMVVITLNPIGEDLTKDLCYQAINDVKISYQISNDLSTYIVKAVDFSQSADLMTSKSEIHSYIEQYFVTSQEVEIEVETEVEVEVDGEMTTVTETSTETITVYYFKTLTEIIDMLSSEPFSFTDEDIDIIQALYFDGSDIDITLKGKYPMPVSGRISSGYGERIDPLNGKYFIHPALDIVPEHHAPVSSIANGTVLAVNMTDGDIYGNNVTIRHEQNGDVFYSFSAHLSKIDVREGQSLSQGQLIGLEGGDPSSDPNPGRTTGHHLHFEIWTGSTRASHVDPSLYLGG